MRGCYVQQDNGICYRSGGRKEGCEAFHLNAKALWGRLGASAYLMPEGPDKAPEQQSRIVGDRANPAPGDNLLARQKDGSSPRECRLQGFDWHPVR